MGKHQTFTQLLRNLCRTILTLGFHNCTSLPLSTIPCNLLSIYSFTLPSLNLTSSTRSNGPRCFGGPLQPVRQWQLIATRWKVASVIRILKPGKDPTVLYPSFPTSQRDRSTYSSLLHSAQFPPSALHHHLAVFPLTISARRIQREEASLQIPHSRNRHFQSLRHCTPLHFDC